jgi:nucleoside-diphosphate-sugar epimerase
MSEKVVITGGTGFVLSNVARLVHERRPAAEIVLVDLAPPDPLTEAFLAGFDGRLRLVRGDVRDAAFLRSLSDGGPPTHVVHGAAITHSAEAERADPLRFIEVNFSGTVAVLEWLRTLPALRRFVFVSTGGVYGTASGLSPRAIQPEAGPFDPPELYAATKYAAELMVRRYAALFGLSAVRVRPSDVFGRMERPTGARIGMSLPWRMAAAWREGRPLLVSERSLAGGGDYVSTDDVAEAFLLLLFAETLPHDVFNIAAGEWRTVAEIMAAFASVAPGFAHVVVPREEAEIDFDPANRLARYNAYDVSRLAALGWRPRSLGEGLADYLAWLGG